MSNYNSLKTTINANIKQNGRQEITGQILNSVLNQMVTTLGAGYQFAGVATTATNPGSPDAKVFYIANGKGTYTNFGGLEVTEDEMVVLYWDTAWHKEATGIASQAKLSELELRLIELVGIGYNAESVGAKEGDYYFSTSLNSIRYKTSTSSEEVPFIKGALYSCKGTIYKWDFDNELLYPVSTGILNVNTLTHKYASFYTLEQAVSAIPKPLRMPLQIIQYRTSKSSSEYAQYLASDVSDNYWSNLQNWKKVLTSQTLADVSFLMASYGNLNINAWQGTSKFYTLEEAIALVPMEMRRTGLKLTFRTSTSRWETAIYTAKEYGDNNWHNTSYWHIDNNIPVININDITETQTTYYTLEGAIALVPKEYRSGGCIVTFRRSERERYTYQYLPGTPSDNAWNNLDNWLELYGESGAPLRDFISGDDSVYFSQRGYQIDKNDGSAIKGAASYYACTPYMPIQLGLMLNVCEGGVASRCSFYDKDYQFISSIVVAATNGINQKLILTSDNVPTNAVYFRATGSYAPEATQPYIKGYKMQTISNALAEINKKMSYVVDTQGVNWMALGDSITQGYYSDDVEPYYHLDASKSYCRYIADINHWNLDNQAIGGTGYVCKGPRGDNTNGKELVDTLDFSNTDLVTIAYGVNDWKYNMQLGSMDDDISTDAIIPAMRYVIEKIISSNPLTKIVVITPINCAVGGNESTNYGIGYPFSNNGTLEDIFNAFVEVCKYYGIEYIDMTHSSIFNRKNLLTLLMDKVHPTIPALKAMGRELAAKIPFK